ncbi:hypothetical protein PVAG01_05862 [Phlyctema vagabunda]|uniref:Uncharacterized protein n=1 Tax=Phlyctema vagabunda TaxID=108571 RepID=A0ABR4PEG5_9HELO
MDLGHNNPESPTLRKSEDEEHLLNGAYQSLHSKQVKAGTRRTHLRSAGAICSIVTGIASCFMILLLASILASEHHIVTLEEHRHAKSNTTDGEVLHPFVFEKIHETWKGCGTNVAEARAMGCLYDVMLGGWIHSDCYWGELMEEYIAEGEYRWYRDENLTVEMSLAEVRLGEHKKIWTKKYYHYAHCAYLWNLQMRAFRERVPVDHSIMEEEHTVHCSSILRNQNTLTTTSASLTTEFEYCGRPGLD